MVVCHLLWKTGWSTVVVNETRPIRMEISPGMRSLHFQDFFLDDRMKGNPMQAKRPGTSKN